MKRDKIEYTKFFYYTYKYMEETPTLHDDLIRRLYPKNNLTVVEDWDPYFHGVGSNENIREHYKLMQNLDFVLFSANEDDNIMEQIDEFNETDFKIFEGYLTFKRNPRLLVVRGMFNYKGRTFAIPNKSFGRFIKKMKKRYSQKIQCKKSIANLRYRECYGKFKRF